MIPEYNDNLINAKVIAGEVFGVKGPITARTQAYFVDFTCKKIQLTSIWFQKTGTAWLLFMKAL